ncbi:MAG TPA: winged helix-turn-helix domain-containing protein, partial [Caulobacteraceae bacterium]
MIEVAQISDPRAAGAFARPRQRSIVLALIGQERSPSELSALTGSRLNLLHHHLGKLVALGLIHVAREQRRGGRAVKYYRATAKAFSIPAELMTAPIDGDLAGQLRERLEFSRMRTVQGVVYSWENGGPSIRLIHDPASRLSGSELWLELRLTAAEAATLTEQMSALLRPFYGRSVEAGERYIVHTAIAKADS